jgi:3-dehydroquinate synthase
MGTGKTQVGREVARRLRRPFLDMDAEIESRAGKSIPHLFAEDGEPAFRRIESTLCLELGEPAGRVIATGGGALVDPESRDALLRGGTIVCLTCSADEILQRLQSEGDLSRPLLAVDDPRAEIEHLLQVRRKAYRAIPWQVDTTSLSVAEVAERLLPFAGVLTLPVRHPSGQYPIHLGEGLLPHTGSALRAVGIQKGTRVALVSNPVVAPHYAAAVEASLQSAHLVPCSCPIPDGEQHKTIATTGLLYEQFLRHRLDRSSLVLSLGGGVTGDIAGYAAATFMRGVRFAQVPTTLLAMADASVGGKVGVDLPQGKNLVGAFKQPELVIIDPTVLSTLPEREARSGMAEVIKHGIIGDPDLFARLEGGRSDPAGLLSVAQLAQTLQVKIAVVENDPFEQGHRAALNLGHTVAHALERLSDFTWRHGEAVAVGMVAAAKIAVKLTLAEPYLADRIQHALAAWELPVRIPEMASIGTGPLDAGTIWNAMAHDKKRRGRALRWVLPRAVGQVEIVDDVPSAVVKSVLRDLGARREP